MLEVNVALTVSYCGSRVEVKKAAGLTADGSGAPQASLITVQGAAVTDQQVLHVLMLLLLILVCLRCHRNGGRAVRT